jgi:processive 1,2-diacylglycerol beta-glucosyltransferase
MPAAPRILIVTAAFGEGHNSAARNTALALEAAGATTRVCDPCSIGTPRITAIVNHAYRLVTTRFPKLWAWIYRSTDRCDFSRKRSPLMRRPEQALARAIRDFRPDALVSTYPLYPYFIPRIGVKLPVFTVVTDSMEINAAWLRAPTDFWLVTDPATRETMAARGLDATKVIETGFPVHPVFSSLAPLPASDTCEPFRILYFPTAQIDQLGACAEALLNDPRRPLLTLVLGRNVRRLYHAALAVKQSHPGRVRILGWTRKVPQLLARHHLIVGKAGGATVHEAIAAQCPMLIHHLVPGQEEGNLRLLESIGGGALADSPAMLTACLSSLLDHQATRWHDMKHALARHNRSAGAIVAADFVLTQISHPQTNVPNPAS